MNISKILLVFIFCFYVAPSFANSSSSFSSEDELYVKYCRGGFNAVSDDLRNTQPNEPNYISNQLWYYSSESGISEALAKLNVISDLSSLSELERIFYAKALLSSFSSDLGKISRLLNFHSKDPNIENHRLIYENAVDNLNGKPAKNTDNLKEVFKNLPYTNYSVLVSIFNNIMLYDRQNAKSVLGQYYKFIDELSENNPYKFVLLSYKNTVESDWRDLAGSYALATRAYEICPKDSGVVGLYMHVLERQNKVGEEKSLITNEILSKKYHHPALDLRLAQIYRHEGNVAEAEKYISMAESKELYLNETNKKSMHGMSGNSHGILWIVFSASVLLVIGLLVVFLRRR